MRSSYLSGFSRRFHLLSQAHGQVPYVLLTRSPLSLFEKQAFLKTSFDLHVLGMPPAFILSQDQTLHLIWLKTLLTLWFLFFLVRFISFEIDVSCLVFKDRNVFRFLRLVQRSYIIPNILPPVNAFFIFFSFFYRNCYNITEKDTNKAFSRPLLVSFI